MSIDNALPDSKMPLSELHEFFYESLGRQTSACLYGSAASGGWVEGRSDLDLFVHVPVHALEQFGRNVREWRSVPGNPLLDGFVIFESEGWVMAKAIERFDAPSRSAESAIDLVDLWNIKSHSKHLFGNDLRERIREIDELELRHWAIRHIERFWIPFMTEGLCLGNTELEVPLSKVVWTASGVARILMLARGLNGSSKQQALLWLADECGEVRETMNLLAANFNKLDFECRSFSGSETHRLGEVYLRLLRQLGRFRRDAERGTDVPTGSGRSEHWGSPRPQP